MGLIGSTLSLFYCGGSGCYFSPISFIQDPCLWFALISRYHATHLQAPNFAYSLLLRRLSSSDTTKYDVSSVQHVFDAAEPISVEVARKFITVCSTMGLKRAAFTGGYGLAESCVYVTDGGQRILRLRRDLFEKEQIVEVVSEEDIVTQRKNMIKKS